MTWTKGYLTGGVHPSTLEEWDALYRLEGARRRWRLYRGYYQQASARYSGPPPYIVTARHVLPNPGREQIAETNRRWAERQAEHEKERLARRQALLDRMAPLWGPVGGRNRWIVQQCILGRDPGAIAADVELSRTRVNQILQAQQRKARSWRAPRGRVFDPDPMYPRDVWITWAPETDPNDIQADHQAA